MRARGRTPSARTRDVGPAGQLSESVDFEHAGHCAGARPAHALSLQCLYLIN